MQCHQNNLYLTKAPTSNSEGSPPPPDKDNILSPMESKIEPQLHIYSQVGKYASAVIKDQVKKNAKPPE